MSQNEQKGFIPSHAFRSSLNSLKATLSEEEFAFVLLHYTHKVLNVSKEKIAEMLNSSQIDLN